MVQAKKQNYLNNKDLLKEIHKSKMTYCYIQDERYLMVDIIVDDVTKINKETIKQAQLNRVSKLLIKPQ